MQEHGSRYIKGLTSVVQFVGVVSTHTHYTFAVKCD